MSYEIEVRELKAQPFVGVREKTTPEGVSNTFQKVLPEAWKYATENGGKPAGPPMAIFHSWSEQEADIEGGVTLEASIPGTERVHAGELPAGKIAVTRHVGSYHKLGNAHDALRHWMEANNASAAGPPWEVYITDPQENPDPATWVTEIYQPLKQE